MEKLYFCRTSELEETLKKALSENAGSGYEIKRTENGKPYIEGNPLFFSLSHSGNSAVIALCDKPVGIDMEVDAGRNFSRTLSRFTEREKREIDGDRVKFYYNWVAKEAFIKMSGGTLAHDLKRLEYFGGKLYYDGIEPDCTINFIERNAEKITAVCTAGYYCGKTVKKNIKLI